MVKSELVRLLSEKCSGLQENDVEFAINCMLGQLTEAIIRGERIEIRGFGSFESRHRLPRIARNPKSGEKVHLPAKIAIHFKPGKELKTRVDAVRNHFGITE